MCSNLTINWTDQLLLPDGQSPTISALMFSAGVLGNLIALALLARRWRGESGRGWGCGKPNSLFHVLVTELVFTDLLGTCFISPVVMVSYAQKKTLVALEPEGHRVCKYFAFAMTFFSLATMLMLLAMALERYLSIGHPYFYQRHVTCRLGLVLLPSIYAASLLFCSLPLLSRWEYKQYCPGTWCFISPQPAGYLELYASLVLLIIVVVLLCNCSVILHLVRMHRRNQRTRCGPSMGSSIRGGSRSRKRAERLSMAEEMDHLILLAVMTLTFTVCSLPVTVSAYIDTSFYSQKNWDLLALRFLSINSIIDPWVFAIFRPPVLRLIRSVLCCRVSLRAQDATQTSSSP